MKKMSDKDMYDYLLYIKKYKPDIWRDLQGNKKVQKVMNKFESVVVESITKNGFMEIKGQTKYLMDSAKNLMRAIKNQNDLTTREEVEYIHTKSKLMMDLLKDKRYNESVNEVLKYPNDESKMLVAFLNTSVDGNNLKQVINKKVKNHRDFEKVIQKYHKSKGILKRYWKFADDNDEGIDWVDYKFVYDQMKKHNYLESVNEGIMDTVDSFNDSVKKEIFSIGKKDKKMGLELARLYKKYFIEFSVRMKKLTKDSELIETKKRDSRGTLRDYKKEYKKYGSSTKSKKYRAELNKYNRKKGTYGNGDGKDASHKGGKIVGFESQSKNRGRAEKSRLKK